MATKRSVQPTGKPTGTDWGNVLIAVIPPLLSLVKDIFFSKEDSKKENEAKKEIVREVIQAPPVDVRNAELEEIRKANLMLSDYKNKALQIAKDKENRLINIYRKYIDKLIDSIHADIDMRSLERLNNRLQGQLQGSITNAISASISIDNARCAEILKTPEPSYRGTLLQEFIDDINADSLRNAKDILINNLQDSTNDIVRILNDKIYSEEVRVKSSIDYLQDFKTSHDIESKQAKEIAQSYRIFVDSNSVNFLHYLRREYD